MDSGEGRSGDSTMSSLKKDLAEMTAGYLARGLLNLVIHWVHPEKYLV